MFIYSLVMQQTQTPFTIKGSKRILRTPEDHVKVADFTRGLQEAQGHKVHQEDVLYAPNNIIENTKKTPENIHKELSKKLIKLDSITSIPPKTETTITDKQKLGIYYEDNIFEYLLNREKKYIVNYEVLTRGNPKIVECRALAIDWLVLVAHKLFMSQETVYLMVNLVDRTLSLDNLNYERIQLLGIASLYLTSKIEEYYPASVSDMIKLSQNAYEKEEVFALEKELLQLHNFNVHGVEPMTFMNRLILSTNHSEDADFKETVILLYDTLLTCKHYSSLRCSLLSAGAVFGAVTLYGDKWTDSLVSCSKYKESDLAVIAKKMLKNLYFMKTETSIPALNGVRRKYLSKSQHRDIINSGRIDIPHLVCAIHAMWNKIKAASTK
nr:putative cyclin-A3-1 [Lepeophtheirus salmonis]